MFLARRAFKAVGGFFKIIFIKICSQGRKFDKILFMKILAVETSCDETAVALIKAGGGLKNPRFKIFKNLVASQVKIHQPFGGIVPNLAKREHLKNLPFLFKKLRASGFKLQDSDLIAVTVGPGLEPALWTGIAFINKIRAELLESRRGPTRKKEIKIVGASHLEGHLYSFLLNREFNGLNSKNLFPAVALIVSGGHTALILMKNLADYKKIGETRDDAVGEAFDKVARLLNLPYPGGPEIEKLAKRGNAASINFPRPMIGQKNYDFSFSGLKTAVLYYLRDAGKASKADVAASFQAAAFDVLAAKTLLAAKEFRAKSIMVGGGVASSQTLKKYFRARIKKENPELNLLIPPKKFCLDNAVMIGASAYINYLRKKNYRLKAQANLPI